MLARLKWLVPVLTLFLALALMSASSRAGGRIGPLNTLALEVAGPVNRLLTSAVGAVGDFWRRYFYLVDLRRENEQLRRLAENQARRIVDLAENQAAAARLASLLGLREAYPHLLMKPAHILAWAPGPWFRMVIISLGARDGVALDQAVIHDLGVVGRVVEVTPNYARVLLVTDFSSSIDAFVQRSRAVGLLSGEGGKFLNLKYVRKDEDVRPGDQVVTSGLDGFFPRGLALGTVSRVSRRSADMFMQVEVRPQTPFDRLEEVMVVINQGPALDWLTLAPALRPLLEDALEEERRR
ncbi:MAG: rod shape-determining protein MreC [Candidatus Adiutrix sp.]|jgi:rod shape-determining protein MreC|nr:rod shape-determining protein MreC [Candidatus Adiutrix sp.]